MNPVKRLVAQFRSTKRRVKKRFQVRRLQRTSGAKTECGKSDFEKLAKNYAHQSDYEEFVLNFRLRNFASAASIAQRLDYDRLKSRQKLAVLKVFYSSWFGVIADSYLEVLCDEILTQDQKDARLIVGLIERVAMSGFDAEKKLKLIKFAKELVDHRNPSNLTCYYALQWQEYAVKKDSIGDVDPIDFIDVDGLNRHGAELAIKFLGSLKAFGHNELVRSLVAQLYERFGVDQFAVFRAVVSFYPEAIGQSAPLGLGFLTEENRLAALPSLYSARHLHKEIEQAFESACQHLTNEFHRLDVIKQDTYLRFLLRQERYTEVIELGKGVGDSRRLLSIAVAQGYISFANDDYLTARDCFQRVLEEDPSDPLAAVGLEFCLPRTGQSMKGLISIRDRIGYGQKGFGRPGVRYHRGERTKSFLFSGDYVHGQHSKSEAPQWVALKESYGKKFLNCERLSRSRGRSLFVIGDEGVGDEIRTAQFYSELSRAHENVTASCDPRLFGLFSRSFPNIKFLPVPRIRKVLGNGDEHSSNRLHGFGEKISNYLTENCRKYLDESDFVTYGQNVFFNYFIGDIKRPDPGPYLTLPGSHLPLPTTNKLRVGILWRSHLRSGARKMMYLDVEDFLPLTGLDGVELWSIQHAIDEEELEFCRQNNIRIIEDVDLFNDFEGLSTYLSQMDLLIGISSVPMELGAAFGTEVWMLGFSPENYYLRTSGGKSEYDMFTLNSKVIAPPWIDFTQPRSECIRQVFDEVVLRIEKKLEQSELAPMAD